MIAALGPNVRRRRERLGLSLDALADAARVPSYYLAQIEASSVEQVDIWALGRVAEALRVDATALISGPWAVVAGGAPRSCRAEIVATGNWPARLMDAASVELLIAQSAADDFGIELWGRALNLFAGLYREGK